MSEEGRWTPRGERRRTLAELLRGEEEERGEERTFDEQVRFKVPGFDGAKEVYRFDETFEGERLSDDAADAEEAPPADTAGTEEGRPPGQTGTFDSILSDVDEETDSEKYSSLLDEVDVSQGEIDDLVREELAKRGLLRFGDDALEDSDEDEARDIYVRDLVSENDPLIARLEEEAKRLREMEAEDEIRLTRREKKERRLAEKKAEAERRALEKEAARAAKERGAESQIEAERRMIAELREAEAQARKEVEKRRAKRRKQALRAEKRRAGRRGLTGFIVRFLEALLVCAFALTLLVITMCFLGRSEMVNTTVTEIDISMPDGVDGEVLDDRTIVYNGQTLRYDRSRSNILVLGIDPGAKAGKTLDSAILISLDTGSGKAAYVSISADTICEADSYDAGGMYLGLVKTTLRSAYSMAGGGSHGCENAAAAVSRLLYGIPVNAYLALDLRSIPALADAVGGVDAVVTSDFAARHKELKAGSEISLTGDLAGDYVTSFGYPDVKKYQAAEESSERLSRQKLFALGFLKNALRDTRENPLFPLHLTNFLKNLASSNLNLTRKTYLMSLILRGGPEEELSMTVSVNAEVRDGAVRCRVRPKKLYAQLVKIFFEEA